MDILVQSEDMTLEEAWRRYVPSDLREEVNKTQPRVGPYNPSRKQAHKIAVWDAWKVLHSFIQCGDLRVEGFVEPRTDPTAKRVGIPDDVLTAPDLKIGWKSGKISGNGMSFVGVFFLGFSKVEDLFGLTLNEAFQRFVLDDPELCELKEEAQKEFSGWGLSSLGWYHVLSEPWPVNFENWDGPVYQAWRRENPILTLDCEDPWAPEIVTEVYRLQQNLAARLIGWMRSGKVVAEGVEEPPTHAMNRSSIAPGWWSKDGARVSFKESTLLLGMISKPRLMFSDINLQRPQAPQVLNATSVRGEREAPPTSKLYAVVRDIVAKIDDPLSYFKPRGRKVNWARAFHKEHPNWKEGSIVRELQNCLNDI